MTKCDMGKVLNNKIWTMDRYAFECYQKASLQQYSKGKKSYFPSNWITSRKYWCWPYMSCVHSRRCHSSFSNHWKVNQVTKNFLDNSPTMVHLRQDKSCPKFLNFVWDFFTEPIPTTKGKRSCHCSQEFLLLLQGISIPSQKATIHSLFLFF